MCFLYPRQFLEHSLIFDLMFPNPNHNPAFYSQFSANFGIPCFVCRNLLDPICAVCFRNPAMTMAPMPQASVNEENNLAFWKYKIRFPGERIISPPPGNMLFPEERNYRAFCGSVPLCFHSRHDSGAFRRRDVIHFGLRNNFNPRFIKLERS